MTERAIFVLWFLSWPVALISTPLFCLMWHTQVSYHDSMQKKLDAIRGFERKYPVWRFLFIAIAAWSLIYILW